MSTELIVFYREQLKESEKHWEYSGKLMLSKEKYTRFYNELKKLSPVDAHSVMSPEHYGKN